MSINDRLGALCQHVNAEEAGWEIDRLPREYLSELLEYSLSQAEKNRAPSDPEDEEEEY